MGVHHSASSAVRCEVEHGVVCSKTSGISSAVGGGPILRDACGYLEAVEVGVPLAMPTHSAYRPSAVHGIRYAREVDLCHVVPS